MSDLMWYAYLHTNGQLFVKRFFDEHDATDAEQSPFVRRVIGPFPAETREEAEAGARNRFDMLDRLTRGVDGPGSDEEE